MKNIIYWKILPIRMTVIIQLLLCVHTHTHTHTHSHTFTHTHTHSPITMMAVTIQYCD